MRRIFVVVLLLLVAVVVDVEGNVQKTFGLNRPRNRTFVSTVVDETINEIASKMKDAVLAEIFANALPNTLDTTVHANEGDTFVITGDIPAMWLRDSTNQVLPYLRFASKDVKLQNMLKGVVNRQVRSVLIDPYANAFNFDSSKPGEWAKDLRVPKMTNGVWEGKYELDSLCAVMKLSYEYFQATNDSSAFDDTWAEAMTLIVDTIRSQQRGTEHGTNDWKYKFQRLTYAASDSLTLYGIGPPAKTCGLSRSAFRPSDDANKLPYPIAANAMAVVNLHHLSELTSTHGPHPNETISQEALRLSREINDAILAHGIIDTPQFGQILTYEVDCYGNTYSMDDANIPSLLSLPYLGYIDKDSDLYMQTRKWVLSEHNPYFFSGTAGEGTGGPHVGFGWVWPMSVTMRALTSDNDEEIMQCLDTLRDTTNGTYFMHESFWMDDAAQFTRPWFAWANSLFGELILTLADERPHLIF